MITTAIFEHNLVNRAGMNYFELVSKFRTMTYDNLKRLAIISHNPMFDFFVKLIPEKAQDFD